METLNKNNELITVVQDSGLELQTANYIKEQFLPFFEQAQEWREKALTLNVTDVSQTKEMRLAREARLALKNIRLNADKVRKNLKEDSLRYGKAVQGVYNVIDYLIVPTENHLQLQEDFAIIQEEKVRSELKAEREHQLSAFSEFVPFGIDLSRMEEVDYQKLLNGCKLQLENQVQEQKRIEKERIERELKEKEEREKIRIENEKLKREAIENEARLKAEREEAKRKMAELLAINESEAKEIAKKEREEKEALEAIARKLKEEIQSKIDAEKREEEEKQASIEAELSKGDKEKLLSLLSKLSSLKTEYTFKSKKHIALQISINELIDKTIAFAKSK